MERIFEMGPQREGDEKVQISPIRVSGVAGVASFTLHSEGLTAPVTD